MGYDHFSNRPVPTCCRCLEADLLITVVRPLAAALQPAAALDATEIVPLRTGTS
jgi:hypothetical protein